MVLKVNPHTIEILEKEATNEKEVNVSDITFEFSEEITDDFETIPNANFHIYCTYIFCILGNNDLHHFFHGFSLSI